MHQPHQRLFDDIQLEVASRRNREVTNTLARQMKLKPREKMNEANEIDIMVVYFPNNNKPNSKKKLLRKFAQRSKRFYTASDGFKI